MPQIVKKILHIINFLFNALFFVIILLMLLTEGFDIYILLLTAVFGLNAWLSFDFLKDLKNQEKVQKEIEKKEAELRRQKQRQAQLEEEQRELELDRRMSAEVRESTARSIDEMSVEELRELLHRRYDSQSGTTVQKQ